MTTRRQTLALTTAADGSFTGYIENVRGFLGSIQYIKGNFDNGSTITITDDTTGVSLWTESNVNVSTIRYPRSPVHQSADGAVIVGGFDQILLAMTRVKIVIASGGNAKTATFAVTTADVSK